MMHWLPILIALLATGALAGLLAGLLGVGGGIVIVPVLYWVFQFLGVSPATSMVVATGTSLLTIIPTSVSSIRSHHARGNVDWDLVKFWWPFIVAGVIGGVLFAIGVGGSAASIVFGVVAIAIALNMLFRPGARALMAGLPSKLWQAVTAAVIGAVSATMGIGGGTLGVLALTSAAMSTHRAVGTSAAFGLVIALPGAALMLALGHTPADAPVGTFGRVNLLGFAAIVPLTVITAPLGVKLGARLDSVVLKRVFAVFLIASGLRMLYQNL